jgi:hypothetical protein
MLGTTMDRTKLQVLATELASDIKTEADLNALSRGRAGPAFCDRSIIDNRSSPLKSKRPSNTP